jgi:hypothetical protein
VDEAALDELVTRKVGAAVEALPVAKDGVGVAGAVIDRDGQLILTLGDGQIRELGVVVGRDVDMDEVGRRIAAEVAKFPKPADGKNGFDLKHFDTEMKRGGRVLVLKFDDGERVETHELAIDAMIYRGVYKAEAEYERGDVTTFDGGMWHCEKDTTERPGNGSKDWVLAVKAGRSAASVYDICRKHGFRGTEAELIELLVGKLPPAPPIKLG